MFSVLTFAQADFPDTGPVNSAAEAFHRAYLYTGFKEIKAVTPFLANRRAICVRLENDNTPFLRDSVIGRPVWLLEIRNVEIRIPDPNTKWEGPYCLRSFTVVIDSTAGWFIRIFSTAEEPDTNLAPEPPADTAASMMRATGEVWVRFPDTPPKVPFFQAVNEAAGSDPFSAKEILAVCVVETDKFKNEGKPTTVWSITGRGITPFELHPTKAPLYMRNRNRSIIDATTGKLIGITNLPSVMKRKPKETAADTAADTREKP